jgi:hypothetical protein
MLAGPRDVDLPLEHRDALAIDAEDREGTVPETLRLGALGTLALPLAGERQRARQRSKSRRRPADHCGSDS